MAKYRIVNEDNYWYAEKYIFLVGWIYVYDTISSSSATLCENRLLEVIKKPKTIIVKEIRV